MEIARAPAHVVWNLTEMTGYDAAARVSWQHALWPLRHRIHGIEVVGGNPVVRIGAVTLTMVLGIEARFVETARASHTERRERPAGAAGSAVRSAGRQAA